MSEVIDSAKEVSRCPFEVYGADRYIVHHDLRLVAVARAPGQSKPGGTDLTPDFIQLRRPAAFYPEWRLDRLLKRKAEEGVRIYVMVYKEVTASMSLSSKHTKVRFPSPPLFASDNPQHALEDLHDNIAVSRHPDHSGNELVYYFSHHEKLCIIDNRVVCMGGLDACFGRWDTRNHPLSDVHPTENFRSLFPGQGELLQSGKLGGWRGAGG